MEFEQTCVRHVVRVTHVVLRVQTGLHVLLFIHPLITQPLLDGQTLIFPDIHPPTPQLLLEEHPETHPPTPHPLLDGHELITPDTHPLLLQADLLQP